MNLWWVVLQSGGCIPAIDDVIMDCDARIAVDILLNYGYQEDTVELYEVKLLEKVGEWDLRPIPFPGFPITVRYSRVVEMGEVSSPWWIGNKFAYTCIDEANCHHVYTFKTLKETEESIIKYKYDKYLVLEILHEVKIGGNK